MAPLLQMQTLTPNPIQTQDPLLTTPTPTPTMTTTTPTSTPKTTPTPTPMMTPTPNLSLIQTLIPILTSTPAPTQAQIPIPIPTQPVSYASSAAQIMTSRLTTPTHGPDWAYCGDPRHSCETCFKSHGYPNWWATLTDRGQCNMISNGTGYGFHTSNKIDSRSWIIDSGATDHMTFDPDDFLNTTQPRRTCIANANGVTHPVTGAGTDIHTKEILGRGFKDSDFTCDTCILAKSHSVPYPLSTNKCTTPFTLIHSDVWGPSHITAPSSVRWFVTFIDDCTRMTWLYLLKNKNEVFSCFQSFHKQMKTQFNAQIQILRSNNGGEFVNHDFQTYFQQHGIIHEATCPQTPQQNGVAERKN
ncbi:hypothetical protein L3X38_033093 [Prunus dulcis]|uniref:Integrase catalytic domain-containing protein n=1 Tax=Prunus dulcis TaxID=3755 RepID=A0AAD4VFB0_PRUDU|nr:hypothetical protein L3X38_033093 [Prunus dulcis]